MIDMLGCDALQPRNATERFQPGYTDIGEGQLSGTQIIVRPSYLVAASGRVFLFLRPMSNLPEHVPFTQTARSLFAWIPFLGPAETKVVFALYELTYGHDKGQGVRLFSAELEAATGLSDRGVRDAVLSLAERGAIRFKPGKNCRDATAYQVLIGWKPTPFRASTPEQMSEVDKMPQNGNSHLNPRTNVGGVNPRTNVGGTPEQMSEVLNTKSNTKKDSPCKSPTPSSEALAQFDSLWSIYPKKVAKKEARKVFLKLHPTPELVSQIETWIRAAILTDQWRDGVIPHLATALNNERWTDDVSAYNRGHRNGTNGHKPAAPLVTDKDYMDRDEFYKLVAEQEAREAHSK